ncbi:MAG TPA: hemerythrin domain-containing protein [Bacteroidota bacterium]|nr:hemerythrin domain-containing protein [Bacteroidota bacterium]
MNHETITQYYETDHDRLDELFNKFQELKYTDYAKAKEYFKEFKSGLQRHIIWEEEILFPLFERKTGLIDQGSTHVMRAEHRMIGKYLEAVHEKVKVRNPESDEEEQLLLNALSLHNHKEESVLYPAIDHAVSDAERGSVFSTMKQLPDERFSCCCTHDTVKQTTD